MAGNFQITTFNPTKQATPGELTDTCSGEALNTGSDDYAGIAVIDMDTQQVIQAAMTDVPVPSGYGLAWESEKDVMMPDKNLNLRCGVGYYVPAENTIYETDYREFVISKSAVNGKIPWNYILIGGGVALAALMIPIITKKRK